jgi:hypothetical protein
VRRTDDRVQGRIVWANAVSVKVKWDDGQQVTWRRDSLAGRPIDILAADGCEGRPQAAPADADQTATNEPSPAEPRAVPGTPPAEDMAATTVPVQQATPGPPPTERPTADQTATEQAATPEPHPLERPGSANERKRRRAEEAAQRQAAKAKHGPGEATGKKLSARGDRDSLADGRFFDDDKRATN